MFSHSHCWKCKALINPEDITPHLRNCSGKKENKPRAEEKSRCSESPAKRQKSQPLALKRRSLLPETTRMILLARNVPKDFQLKVIVFATKRCVQDR
ncbi:hypothetical protein ACF0H5_023746 [Mactra antiquata]